MSVRQLPFLLIGLALIALAGFWSLSARTAEAPALDASGFYYTNASANDITVELPFPDAVVGKEFSVIGKARGPWYFEASFPVVLTDWDGKIIAETHAEAQGDWMTEEYVPFKADVTVPESYIGRATLILKNDNPSGEPSRDKALEFMINVEY